MEFQKHTELEVYRKSFDAAMSIFESSKFFPKEEINSLTDQVRRSSRSVCADLVEAWRKRRYEAAFVAKLCDAVSEAAETQVWLEFAVKFHYLNWDQAVPLYQTYDEILRMLVGVTDAPESWIIAEP